RLYQGGARSTGDWTPQNPWVSGDDRGEVTTRILGFFPHRVSRPHEHMKPDSLPGHSQGNAWSGRGFSGRTLEGVMQVVSTSEARLYRRCSLAALAILLGSVAGERVLNSDREERTSAIRCPSLEWNVTLPSKPNTLRFLDHFITVTPRHV